MPDIPESMPLCIVFGQILISVAFSENINFPVTFELVAISFSFAAYYSNMIEVCSGRKYEAAKFARIGHRSD